MRLLFLTFYYPPDLSAGSFRAAALVKALRDRIPQGAEVHVVTTLPNRYSTYAAEAPEVEHEPGLTIHRIRLPHHQSGMADQARAYVTFARRALALTRHTEYSFVIGTSSRLMTAALGARIASRHGVPLYLDIRDIFVDTIKDVLPRRAATVARPLFSILERWAVSRATKVNLVSGGFEEYFRERFPGQSFSFYTNGIDPEFVSTPFTPGANAAARRGTDARTVVAYAGNIGEGQGLHAILPGLARRLEARARFRVIGDGGRKALLEKRLADEGCTNVEILPPVPRAALLDEYRSADVLFLHLNDYDAFRKVLPSKIFEYAATGKPIWAGVAGFSASFIRNEIRNAAVFEPCRIDDAIRALEQLDLATIERSDFVRKYARHAIMSEMARDVLALVGAPGRRAYALG